MAKNEAKIKFTAETKDFNNQIKKANNELAKLRAETKLNDTQMQNAGESVDGLKQRHKLLQDQLSASQSKTEALNQKVDKAVLLFGENSDEVAKLKTQLANAQTAEEKLRSAIDKCNQEIADQERASKEAETATSKLTDKIEEQQSELDRLKKDYVEATLKFGDASDEAKDLERSINRLSQELKENKDAMSQASEKANSFDKSMGDAKKSSDGASGGFTTLKGTIASLASEAIQAAIAKIKEFIDYLVQLPEATRELRQNLATLTTSFDKAGFSTETAKEIWKELYSVFGDDATAVEAANHIARLSNSQEELSNWTNIVTGLYGTYQDAINPAAIMESAKETAVCGKVTGQFADALNWSSEAMELFAGYMNDEVKTAEDAFNVALSECSTEQERQALITKTLTDLYGDASGVYKDTASSQMDAKNAAAEHMLVENELADAMEPVTTMWQELKTQLLSGVVPAIEKVTTFLTEHPKILEGVSTALQVLKFIIGAIVAILAIAVITSPFGFLITMITLLIMYWDELKQAVKNCVDWIAEKWGEFVTWLDTNVIQPVIQFFKDLWAKIVEIWDLICNAIQVAFMFIGSIIQAAFDIITLPFRFIWENCKEYVFAAFEWIKNAIKVASEWISNLVATIWGWIRDNIVNPVSEAYQKAVEIFNNIRSAISEKITALKEKVSQIFNQVKEAIQKPINEAKERVSSIIDSLKTAISSKISAMKTSVSTTFTNIKEAMQKPIEAAKNKIKSIVDTIKGFFSNLKLKLPNIKLPHFSIKGKFSLDPPSVPKLSITWNKLGAIFTRPTILNTPLGLQGVGEAGPEAVLPIDRLEGYVENAIERTQQVVNFDNLANAIEKLADRAIELRINDRVIAQATASANDSVNGLRSTFRNRGLILE